MIKAIIISGDDNIIEQVKKLVQSFCPSVRIEAGSGEIKMGISLINQHHPDLVFIDTFHTDGSGFELLNHFTYPDFKTIIISEYAEYAVKAIDYGASGYLLKPINDQKFIAAVQRTTEIINQ